MTHPITGIIRATEALIARDACAIGCEQALLDHDDLARDCLEGCEICARAYHMLDLSPSQGRAQVCLPCRIADTDPLARFRPILARLSLVERSPSDWYLDAYGRLRTLLVEGGCIWEHSPLTYLAYVDPHGGLYDPALDWDCACVVLGMSLEDGIALVLAEDQAEGHDPLLAQALHQAVGWRG